MAITGHSTREMFDRYNVIDEQDTHQAVESLGTSWQMLTKHNFLTKQRL